MSLPQVLYTVKVDSLPVFADVRDIAQAAPNIRWAVARHHAGWTFRIMTMGDRPDIEIRLDAAEAAWTKRVL